MQDNHHFLQPLLHSSPTTTTTTTTSSSRAVLPLDDHELNNISTNSQVIFRLALVIFIGIVSIWANHESSKGFIITIVNESNNTISGNRFQLFYVSNDEASRILIKASNIIENYLYPNNNISHTKKQINHVILKLTDQNLNDNVLVKSIQDHEFVLYVSSSIMEGVNFSHDMSIAILRGMAHIWVWDNAPKNLINGIVEYIATKLGDLDKVELETPRLSAGAACWNDYDPKAVADFLEYCENGWPGFIRRLNRAMKDEWHDEKLGMELGLSIPNLCAMYHEGRYNISSA